MLSCEVVELYGFAVGGGGSKVGGCVALGQGADALQVFCQVAVVVGVEGFALKGVEAAGKGGVVPCVGQVTGYEVGAEDVLGVVVDPVVKACQMDGFVFSFVGVGELVPCLGHGAAFDGYGVLAAGFEFDVYGAFGAYV